MRIIRLADEGCRGEIIIENGDFSGISNSLLLDNLRWSAMDSGWCAGSNDDDDIIRAEIIRRMGG